MHPMVSRYVAAPTWTRLPNRERAADFGGRTQHLEVADHDALSPTADGAFTLEAWMRPDTLEHEWYEFDHYVHWMGKGVEGTYEYVARMYNLTTDGGRPNRISGYLFNAVGAGAGSFFTRCGRQGRGLPA